MISYEILNEITSSKKESAEIALSYMKETYNLNDSQLNDGFGLCGSIKTNLNEDNPHLDSYEFLDGMEHIILIRRKGKSNSYHFDVFGVACWVS